MKARISLTFMVLLVGTQVSVFCQPARDPKPCTEMPVYTQIQKPDNGWDLGVIDRSRQIGSPVLLSKGPLKGALRTEYALTGKYFDYADVIVDSGSRIATFCAKYLYLYHASGFSLNGKTFALDLLGGCGFMDGNERIPLMCTTDITLIDTTGSGKFDLLRFGRSAPDSIPGWVTKSSKPGEQNQ